MPSTHGKTQRMVGRAVSWQSLIRNGLGCLGEARSEATFGEVRDEQAHDHNPFERCDKDGGSQEHVVCEKTKPPFDAPLFFGGGRERVISKLGGLHHGGPTIHHALPTGCATRCTGVLRCLHRTLQGSDGVLVKGRHIRVHDGHGRAAKNTLRPPRCSETARCATRGIYLIGSCRKKFARLGIMDSLRKPVHEKTYL